MKPKTPESLTSSVVSTLVENHRQFLSFLEKRVGDRATAEDILQNAFAKGLDKVDSLRQDESAVAWFYRSLRHAVIDHYRRTARSRKGLDALHREVVADDAPARDLAQAICACVARLAETLKPDYAEILRRVEVEGESLVNYAKEAGITASNAGVRAFRAREALRALVVRSCGTCAEHGCLDCDCKPK